MTIDIVELGKFLIQISVFVCILCLALLFKRISDSVKILNKTLAKTEQSMDEVNMILNNVNKVTENFRKLTDGVKNITGGITETMKTVENSYENIRKVFKIFNKDKDKNNN